jgi:hypothetical protein
MKTTDDRTTTAIPGPVPGTRITEAYARLLARDAYFSASSQRRRTKVYASTSYVFADKSAGYSTSDERIVGVNFFPFNTRNVKINGSPVNSVFGYDVGGQRGHSSRWISRCCSEEAGMFIRVCARQTMAAARRQTRC